MTVATLNVFNKFMDDCLFIIVYR